MNKSNQIMMDLKGVDSSSNAAEYPSKETLKSAELLMYHTRFGHISFLKLREMAKQNIIPKYLQHVPTPACSACMFAKATRKPWRNKQKSNHVRKQAVCQGEVVSVDQMISPTPGLIAQMVGRPTRERYKYATIYVDNYSGWSYVHLQKSPSIKETLQGKHAFEEFCRQQGITVRGYHADNGVFKASEWIKDCRSKHQGLTFAGVQAHHTNGKAERRIRLLQDLARTMIIHADRRWGGGAMVHLWPYALRMANDAVNYSPNMQDKYKRTPASIMFNNHVGMNIKHWHPFGCPAYVLEEKLQDDKRIYNKWRSRSRIGIYLGSSPLHARNIALILNMETGTVSPQFHVSYDKTFETIKSNAPPHHWLAKVGLHNVHVKGINPKQLAQS